MQAMADEGQCEATMRPAADERYADADVRERELVQREDVETMWRRVGDAEEEEAGC